MSDSLPITVPPTTDTGTQLPPSSVIATGATLTPSTATAIATTPPDDSLPEDYDPFQHLKQVYYPQHNAAVALFFNDLGSDWKPNIATARSSLRVACTITPDDNELLIAMRHRLFWDLLGYGKSDLFLYQGSIDAITQPVTGHPKVVLKFTQGKATVPIGGVAADMECSFRLVNYTQATYTPALATTLANEIKSLFFVSNAGYVFTKGKNIYNYLDVANGYRLLIRGNDQASATTLIEMLLQLTSTTFDENKLSVSNPMKSNVVETPQQHLVYGQEKNLPNFRPTVNVRFRYAYVRIPGYTKNIILYDATGVRHALVT
ncbi:MAG: hypothetical protein V7L26_12135 [Nostoc sp.]|uniref:hypothetical protein n=1 Tax=Nostoc sp. TaxID=1180 RepID=UPI002FF43970